MLLHTKRLKVELIVKFSTVFVIFEYKGDKKITQIQFCGDVAYLRVSDTMFNL